MLREPGMWSTGDPAPYLKSPNALQYATMHPGSPKALKRIHALIGRRNRWITAACFDIPAGLEIFEYLDDCDRGELD